jgi:hypothetical protein
MELRAPMDIKTLRGPFSGLKETLRVHQKLKPKIVK